MPPSLPPNYRYPCQRGYNCPYKNVICSYIPKGKTCVAIRRAVRLRDKQCVVCGSRSFLTLHHIQPSSVKSEHLVMLCHSCHTKLHQQKVALLVDTMNKKFVIVELIKNGMKMREHPITEYRLPSYEDDEGYILNKAMKHIQKQK